MTSVLNTLWQTISLSGEKGVTNTNSTNKHDESGIETNDVDESQSTPKAGPQIVASDVPSFELSEHTDDGKLSSERTEQSLSTLHTTSPPQQLAPTTKSTIAATPPGRSSSLMPPPGRSSGLMPPPSSSSGLMPPARPAGPLPDRGPPGNSQQRVGSNARGKVLLSPGHSPMDWASLTRSSNLSGVPSLQRVTPSQMKVMNGRKGKPIWSSYQGKVYNITPYLPFHPGGEKELFKGAGRDGTKLFMDVHPWVNWEGMLSSCLVGILVSEDAAGTLEDID